MRLIVNTKLALWFLVLTDLTSCAKFNGDRTAQDGDADGAAEAVDPRHNSDLSEACSPEAISGTNLSLQAANGPCTGRPIDEGEGAAGYLVDPDLYALGLGVGGGVIGKPFGVLPGPIGGDVTKVLIGACQIPRATLEQIDSVGSSGLVLAKSFCQVVRTLANGSFRIAYPFQENQALIVAVVHAVSKASVTIAAGQRQLVYMEAAKDGGKFRWPLGLSGTSLVDLRKNMQLSVGTGSSCVIVSGKAKCWGTDHSGHLGTGTSGARIHPTTVVNLESGVEAISAGPNFHTCAIHNGAAKCWGANTAGQLGAGAAEGSPSSSTPIAVRSLESGVTMISAGHDQTCAVVNQGAKCWGNANGVGQLGVINLNSTIAAVQVDGLGAGVTAISSGRKHSCAVVFGAAKCWGSNSGGALGNGSRTDSPIPVNVKGLESGVTAISASPYSSFTCAVANGAAKCWGINTSGELGLGLDSSNPAVHQLSEPAQVVGLTAGVTAITTGRTHACAIVGGAAKCWGLGLNGELGTGVGVISPVAPTPVLLFNADVTAIAAGTNHTCGITGRITYCWGSASGGVLGTGDDSLFFHTPVMVGVQ